MRPVDSPVRRDLRLAAVNPPRHGHSCDAHCRGSQGILESVANRESRKHGREWRDFSFPSCHLRSRRRVLLRTLYALRSRCEVGSWWGREDLTAGISRSGRLHKDATVHALKLTSAKSRALACGDDVTRACIVQ